jgi:hypothetical protein
LILTNYLTNYKMIRLKHLLKEETFTATNKQSGKTSVFKSKDSRDAAIKAGTHNAVKDKKQPSAPKAAGSGMFGGDYAKDRGTKAASKSNTNWMDDLDSIDVSDIKGKADPSADSWTHNDVFGATFKDPQTGKPISVGDAYEREDNSPAYQKAFAYVSQFDPDGEAIMGTQAYSNLQNKTNNSGDWMDDLDSINVSDIKGKADPNADSFTNNDVFGARFKDPKTGKTITVGDAYAREDDSPAYQKAFAYVSKFDPDKEAVVGTQAYSDSQKNASPNADMGVDKVVYNKRTKTVGIVRMADERGETKTDADGNVNTDELEPYNPMKYPHQKDAQVAPSTTKEIDSRGLWKPFSQSANEPKKINNPTEALPKEIYAKMDNEDSDAGEMDYLSSTDGSIKYGIAKEGDKYYVTLGTEEGEILKSFGKTKDAGEAAQIFMKNLDAVKSKYNLDVDANESIKKEGTIKLTKLMENDPCWKGYKQVGMKDKNGREVPNCVPEGVVNELGGISSIHKLYLAVSENHRKLKADQLAMAKKYNNETDPAKKAKLMDMLKKGTEKLRTVADNLSGVEERYIMSIDKDAELDLNPF